MNMQTLEEYAFLENILNGDKNTITEIKNDEDLDKTKTKQENDRDKHITKLLEFYVENYGIKIKQNKFYKNVLFYVCIVILSLAFLGIGFLIFYITKYTEIKPEGLVHLSIRN